VTVGIEKVAVIGDTDAVAIPPAEYVAVTAGIEKVAVIGLTLAVAT
tara:strand:- start:28 stop:165 length:138 start_codon:yes stop_codon:yes gene_type:complete